MGMDDQVADLQTLHKLTKDMDVPDNSRTDCVWLQKNLEHKNSNHKNYKSVIDLVNTILKRQQYLVQAG